MNSVSRQQIDNKRFQLKNESERAIVSVTSKFKGTITTIEFKVTLSEFVMIMMDTCLILELNFDKNYLDLKSLAFRVDDVRLCPSYGPNFADRMLQLVLDIAQKMNMQRIELEDGSMFSKTTFPNIPEIIRNLGMTKVLLLTRGFGLYARRGYLFSHQSFVNKCEEDVKLANAFLEEVWFRRCSSMFYTLFLFCVFQNSNIKMEENPNFQEQIEIVKLSREQYTELLYSEEKFDPSLLSTIKMSLKDLAAEFFENGHANYSKDFDPDHVYVRIGNFFYGIPKHQNIYNMLILIKDSTKKINLLEHLQLAKKLQTFQTMKSAAKYIWNIISTSIQSDTILIDLFTAFVNTMSDVKNRGIKYLQDSNQREVDIVLVINKCHTPSQFIIVPKKRKLDET